MFSRYNSPVGSIRSTSTSSSFRGKSQVKPKPKVKEEPVETGGFQDFKLVSTGNSKEGQVKYSVMKFQAPGATEKEGGQEDEDDRLMDPLKFIGPVKMNRRDPNYKPKVPLAQSEGEGKPQLDANGQTIPATDVKAEKDYSEIAPFGNAVKIKKNIFKKKIKQIHQAPKEKIRLRREERYPWVIEGVVPIQEVDVDQDALMGGEDSKDAVARGVSQEETWVGRLQGEQTTQSSYVAFVFENDQDQFSVIPVDRWYNFQQRPNYTTLNIDEAEAMYSHLGKGQEHRRWLMKDVSRQGSPAPGNSSTMLMPTAIPGLGQGLSSRAVKAEPSSSMPAWMRRSEAQSAASGSGSSNGGVAKREQQDRAVDWEDDGEEGGDGPRGRSRGGEEGEDVDWEEDFSDDDGLVEFDQADENENKELEERFKKEFVGAAGGLDGKNVDQVESDDEDLFGDNDKDDTDKGLRKLVRKNDKAGAYDSDDDEKNPYLSEEDSSDEEPEEVKPGLDAAGKPTGSVPISDKMTEAEKIAAAMPPVPPKKPSTSNQAGSSSSTSATTKTTIRLTARAPSPGAGGSALLAQRATSPHRKHPQSASSSRPASPGPSYGARGERSVSPSASSGYKRKGTPEPLVNGGEKKAKLEMSRESLSPSPAPAGPPTQEHVVQFIRRHRPSLKKLIKHFKKSLQSDDEAQTSKNKSELIDAVKRVARLEEGFFVLHADFQ